MDSRIYFHQYRRPRVSNPTYLSSNIQNSMSFFNSGPSNFPQPYNKREYLNRYNESQNFTSSKVPRNEEYRPKEIPNRQPQMPAYRPQQPYRQPDQYTSRSQHQPQQPQEQRQPSSKLSNYGERSLVLDQRGVHDKQTSKFDIINLKPRENNQDIRQYPWLTVQNRDDVYYRRMNDIYNPQQSQPRAKTMERPSAGGVVAGRHTYDLEPKVSIDPQKGSGKYFSPKMLNHMDELQHNLA